MPLMAGFPSRVEYVKKPGLAFSQRATIISQRGEMPHCQRSRSQTAPHWGNPARAFRFLLVNGRAHHNYPRQYVTRALSFSFYLSLSWYQQWRSLKKNRTFGSGLPLCLRLSSRSAAYGPFSLTPTSRFNPFPHSIFRRWRLYAQRLVQRLNGGPLCANSTNANPWQNNGEGAYVSHRKLLSRTYARDGGQGE